MTKKKVKTSVIKPKLSYQCKICKLVHTHPKLWIEVHDKVLKDDYSMTAVCNWLNAKVEVLNAGIEKEEDKLPEFSLNNFSKHFRKHNNFELQQALHRQRILTHHSRLDEGTGFSEDEKEIAQQYGEDLATHDLNEYIAISRMIATLEKRLWDYDQSLREDTENGMKPNLLSIQTYQKQVDSLVKLKLELAKLRNSSVVAGAAVQFAVEYAVSTFVESMMAVTEEAQTILSTEMQSSTVPFEVVKMIRERIADNMKGAVPTIVDRVAKDFKIR